MGETPVLQTGRLNLVMLSRDDLALGMLSLSDLSQQLGLPLVPDLFKGAVRGAIEKKLVKMEAIGTQETPWFTYWLIVVRDEGVGAGMVGFKGVPNSLGEVEIGYGIDPLFQNMGYMTEAVKAMVAWAFKNPACKVVTAILSKPDNFASHRVLEKSGFIKFYGGPDGLSFRIERQPAQD